MRRLLVHVEGPTEETFVNNVLGPHLGCRGYSSVAARLMGNARPRATVVAACRGSPSEEAFYAT